MSQPGTPIPAPLHPRMTPGVWRENHDMAREATPQCPKCDRHLGMRLGVFRDSGRDVWLCDRCGEFEEI